VNLEEHKGLRDTKTMGMFSSQGFFLLFLVIVCFVF
jgi:hypothetical protein